MLRLFYISILSLTFSLANGQNLVPNPGFEDYYFLPNNSGQVDSSCKEWFTPWSLILPPFGNGVGSSDYFHEYAQNWSCDIPINGFGYQISNTGLAYIGIHLSTGRLSHVSFYHTYKEYIEVELTEILETNSDYCFELYYNLANINFRYYGTIEIISYKPIKIGALLTDTIVKRYMQTGISQPLNICATPNFETSLVSFKDTVNWIHVKGHFKANGGERYLTIGNFECSPTDYNPDSVAVYIYIDDVKLYKCDPDSVNNEPVDSLQIPNVFTPNGDGYNDKFVYKNQEQWNFETQVFNRWGGMVYDNASSQNWDGRYKGELVSEGVYFYVIKARAKTTGEERWYKGTVSVFYN